MSWSRIRQYLGSQNLNYGLVYDWVLIYRVYVGVSINVSKWLSENFSQQRSRPSGFSEIRAFIKEDSAAVIAQIRDIRDQMGVIKIKRDL